MARVQVFTGVERRRRWSAEQKRAIVSAAFSPGAVVTEVARRADVNSGQKNWTFCGSDRGGQRAAAMYTLITTAKLNNIDPEAWLADVLRRINDCPASRLYELLPWNWGKPAAAEPAKAA